MSGTFQVRQDRAQRLGATAMNLAQTFLGHDLARGI